jgi:hypothetical protein
VSKQYKKYPVGSPAAAAAPPSELYKTEEEEGRRGYWEEEEEEFFNHYKNDVKRHAHTPSGVAGADLKS